MNDLQELEYANKRLQAVLDAAVDAIITIRADGLIESFNPAAERIFGFSAEEVIGSNINILMPQPYRDEHDSYLENYLRSGEKRIIGIGREVMAQRKDRTQFPADVAVSETILGEERWFTGIVRDISERKRAEQQLAEREAFLQTVFDAEPGCLKVVGAGGKLLQMNQAGLAMIEADSLDEVLGQSIFPLIVADDRDRFIALTEAVLAGGSGVLEFEIVGRRGARRRLETHAVPINTQTVESPAMLAITRDVTEHRRAEERALQSERLAAIGQTVTGLAHESRNAFQRSQACLEMLAMEVEGQTTVLELVDRIQRALDHLHHLYEEVRDYAAPVKLDRQPCLLPHIWRDAWTHLEVVRRGKQLEFVEECGIDPEATSCNCDWFAVGQVFRNVLENAIVACSEPGRIELTMQMTVHHDQPAYQVTVKDNGEGIPIDAQKQVFDAFFTTKSKGTGLGMAIARRLVEAHGGEIRLGDCHDGAEIVITLPCSVD